MWNKPWTQKEGFLICGGLITAGLMLEMSVGPVDWQAFTWPANMIVLLCFLLLIASIHLLSPKVYAFRFIRTFHAVIPALVCTVVLTLVMGLTRQTVNGSWINNMLTFWPFVLIYVYLTLLLGCVILRRFSLLWSKRQWKHPGRDVSFMLNHLGLFLVLLCATLGNADMQRLRMVTAVGEPEWRALNEQQEIVELPIAIELKRFIMETYADGTPKRFASDIQVLTKTGKNLMATVDVNKPVNVDGWKIYQYGYDTTMGRMSNISIFELVSDPWLPAVYTGIIMMLLGAVGLFIQAQNRKEDQP